MKQVLAFLFMFFVASASVYAQNKITRYCEIETTGSGKVRAKISFGKIDSLFSFRDAGIKEKLQKINLLSTVPDVLNYMATQGWELVCMAAIAPNDKKFYYFKKEFEYQDIKQ